MPIIENSFFQCVHVLARSQARIDHKWRYTRIISIIIVVIHYLFGDNNAFIAINTLLLSRSRHLCDMIQFTKL